jgi:pimeloyl-ACP methyl ester carboxylesterase
MQYRIAELGVTVTRAESERFAAPLLLIHGLWAGSWVWSRLVGYLGHRGWESWAVDLPGRPGAAAIAGSRIDRREVMERCTAAARAMPAPPILVGHDAGAAVALRLAAAVGAPAIVLVAPALPGLGALRLMLGGTGRALRAILGRELAPPGAPGHETLLGAIDPVARQVISNRLVPEPGRVVYDLLRGPLVGSDLALLPPTLVIGGSRDPVTPPEAVDVAARELAATRAVVDGGHWLPLEDSWQPTADCLHRWVVRTLGDPLLLLRNEDPPPPEDEL